MAQKSRPFTIRGFDSATQRHVIQYDDNGEWSELGAENEAKQMPVPENKAMEPAENKAKKPKAKK